MRVAAAGLVLVALLAAPPVAHAAAARDTPVPVLLYHRVALAPEGTSPALYVRPRLFARQVRALARAGHTAVTLEQARRHWDGGARLPPRPVILSFDDGYADQFRNAARTLRARRWPGVLFLQTERLGARGGLSRAQVRRMIRDGWELGGHTRSHADLTTVDAERLTEEVAGARVALQRAFGAPVSFFAYPYGRFDDAVLTAVEEAGFLGAVTTKRGAAEPGDGVFTLDRLVVNGNFTPRRLLRTVRATSRRH